MFKRNQNKRESLAGTGAATTENKNANETSTDTEGKTVLVVGQPDDVAKVAAALGMGDAEVVSGQTAPQPEPIVDEPKVADPIPATEDPKVADPVQPAAPVNLADRDEGPAKKYANRVKRIKETKVKTTPGWPYAHKILACGHPPKRPTSVMGKIFGAVAAAGKEGISGAELVDVMANGTDFSSNRSTYTAGGVKPVVPWCEDYIVGALRQSNGYLKVIGEVTIPVGETKTDENADQTSAESKAA